MNDSALERKYLLLLSDRLERFKQKSGNLWQCRCPYCGDSPKKNHSHGYFYEKNGELNYCCKRCGVGATIWSLIKRLDDRLYSQMRLEKLRDQEGPRAPEPSLPAEARERPVFRDAEVLREMAPVSALPDSHPVRRLVLDRRIPERHHFDLYACPAFMAHTNRLLPGKFSRDALRYDDGRLVIPCRNVHGRIVGYQGRALGKSGPKYIAIQLDYTSPLVYGTSGADTNRSFFVTEGPIDSMFLENALGVCGSDIVSTLSRLPFQRELPVVAYDCEPRSRETLEKIGRAIDCGYRVVVWPRWFDYKDVNEAVMDGLTPRDVEDIMVRSTYRGLAARAALADWRRD